MGLQYKTDHSKPDQWKQEELFKTWVCYSHGKKKNLYHYLTPYTDINPRQIKYLKQLKIVQFFVGYRWIFLWYWEKGELLKLEIKIAYYKEKIDKFDISKLNLCSWEYIIIQRTVYKLENDICST